MIMRFMGTSRESSNMKSIIKSIVHQIDRIFNKKETKKEGEKGIEEMEKVEELREALRNRLNEASKQLKENQRLIIILDSIDQLSKHDYELEWLICDGLPQNIKMIYSLIPDYPSAGEGSIFLKLKRKLEHNENNYLEMNKFNNDKAAELLRNWLGADKRQLTDNQWELVNKTLNKTSSIYPLHIKVLFDIVSKWTSYEKVDEDAFSGCVTIKETIKYLFKRYETLYGKVLFSHCIFYLTQFEYNGISEDELEDILSIDDPVLTECFQYHHPPVRRFQIALWLKIKYEIKDYLTHKETDGSSSCFLVPSFIH